MRSPGWRCSSSRLTCGRRARRRRWLSYIAAIGLAATAGGSLAWVNKQSDFARIVAIDNYTTYFRVFFMTTARRRLPRLRQAR